VVTYGELYFGAKKSRYHEKNLAIIRRLAELFPIINVTRAVMETFGEIKAKLQRTGNMVIDLDLIIASTALSMNYILVTNNEKHFDRIPGLTIHNWART
jgi:tRNA(fMet)-specific endonuclease VapC